MIGKQRGALILTVLGYGGCVDTAEPALGVVTPRELNTPVLNSARLQGLNSPLLQGLSVNGPVYNGPVFNGPVFNAATLIGIKVNGPVFNGPVFNGPVFNGAGLEGTLFTASMLVNGVEQAVSGLDFIDSEWQVKFTYTDGQGQAQVDEYQLRIDDIYPSEASPEVYLYDIMSRPQAGGEWAPLCVDHLGAAVPAIPLQYYWDLQTGGRVDDPNVVTFACTNAVLGKCTMWGYHPWATAERCKHPEKKKQKDKECETVALRDYHQACTRMARADYCGDGTPWTVEGTPIDLWDRLTPPIETPTTDWFVEAEWNSGGAYCVNDIRQQAWKAEGKYPACFLDKKGNPKKYGDCGSLKKDRALITSTFDKPEPPKKGEDCDD
jgi:hypothetical protein